MAERGTGFPRLSLSSGVKVVETASKFGKSWPKEQFAGFGSQSGASSAKSGAFAARIASLKDYGLITTDKETVSLTSLGIKVAKPVTEGERIDAIKQAFMNVETFKLLFESLEPGEALSIDQVAHYAVFTLGVSRESKDKFIAAFIDSGRFVNLVEFDKEHSTLTLVGERGGSDKEEPPAQQENAENENAVSPTVFSTVSRDAGAVINPSGAPSAEQGVNYSGNGWTLTVLLRTSARLDVETRKKVRTLLEATDDLTDELHNNESKQG